ncbi:hypothetical protein [Nostoc sp. LPT]|nr:hypothetical protein [Nostoc sp. LPT]MBN4001136.1 hypothetical protein [Nostoc sp. LPT]
MHIFKNILPSNMDVYTQFISDWETVNNNEPFWSAVRDLDLVPLVT